MPSYIQAIGRTPHVVGVCVNRIGKVATTNAICCGVRDRPAREINHLYIEVVRGAKVRADFGNSALVAGSD